MAYSFYIYYRVEPSKVAAAELRIRELLDEMRKTTGIAGRLLKKRDEPNLWMEIYDDVTDDTAFEWALADAADRLKIVDCLVAGTARHSECFVL